MGMTTLLLYIVLSYCFLQHCVVYGTGQCPPIGKWNSKSEVKHNQKITVDAHSRVLISYGSDGKYIITVADNTENTPQTIRCSPHLAAGDLNDYTKVDDAHGPTCCVGRDIAPRLYYSYLFKDMNKVRKEPSSWNKYVPHWQYIHGTPSIKALVQCNGKQKDVCDFKYKNVATWIAYGNAETNNLVFKLIISDDGTIKCTPRVLDFNYKDVLLNEQIKNCYVATNGHDVEPHFGVWKLRGFCDGCKDFAYQLEVGVTLGYTNTKTTTNTANIVFKPSILGKELFNLGATPSRAIAVATSYTKADTELFRFHCSEHRPYIYQRQLNAYHMDKDGVFHYIEVKLPMARCHPDATKPPKCGSGKCKTVDNNCQICHEVAMHDPPNPLLDFDDDWSTVKMA